MRDLLVSLKEVVNVAIIKEMVTKRKTKWIWFMLDDDVDKNLNYDRCHSNEFAEAIILRWFDLATFFHTR